MLAAALATVGWTASAQFRISEFSASNKGAIRDRYGDSSDWIEIVNIASETNNLLGWRLTDNPSSLWKWVFPSTTVLSPGGFAVFTEAQFNDTNHPSCIVPFALSELGEEPHLTAATNGVAMAYRHSVVFEASDCDVPFGRHVTSVSRALYPAMSAATPGLPNAPPLVGPVVVSEIRYAPQAGGMEFVELRSIAPTNTPLFEPAAPTNRWRLSGGLSFTFPAGVVLTAGQYALVVGGDLAAFRASNAVPPHVPVWSAFTGFSPTPATASGSASRARLNRAAGCRTSWWTRSSTTTNGPGPRPAAPAVARLSASDPSGSATTPPTGAPASPVARRARAPRMATACRTNGRSPISAACLPEAEPDRDGDGRPDRAQFIFGWTASNPVPPLVLELPAHPLPLAAFTARAGGTGPGYQGRQRWCAIEVSTSMAGGVWHPLTNFSRIPAQGQTVVVTNRPDGGFRALRVRAWMEGSR